MEDEVEELLLEQLKDVYSAEKQALRCMQQSARKASSPLLKMSIETHVEETKDQIGRLDEILQAMNAKPGRKLCLAMKGLVDEATAETDQHGKGPILDLVIAASMQRIEHYEISAYGTLTMAAEALELQPVVKVLQQTLAEEQQTEAKLARLAKEELMTSALEDGGEEETDEPDLSPQLKRPGAKSNSVKPASDKQDSKKPRAGKSAPAAPRRTASAPAARRAR
jgi:ferritin-like metal-binding protein YciE